jgi:hypothetical protein
MFCSFVLTNFFLEQYGDESTVLPPAHRLCVLGHNKFIDFYDFSLEFLKNVKMKQESRDHDFEDYQFIQIIAIIYLIRYSIVVQSTHFILNMS